MLTAAVPVINISSGIAGTTLNRLKPWSILCARPIDTPSHPFLVSVGGSRLPSSAFGVGSQPPAVFHSSTARVLLSDKSPLLSDGAFAFPRRFDTRQRALHITHIIITPHVERSDATEPIDLTVAHHPKPADKPKEGSIAFTHHPSDNANKERANQLLCV